MKISIPEEIDPSLREALETNEFEVLPWTRATRLEGTQPAREAHCNLQENADGTVRVSSLQAARDYFHNRFNEVLQLTVV